MHELNRVIHAEGFHGLTTAVVAGFYVSDSNLSVCYAGHPPVLLDQSRKSHIWDEVAVPSRPGRANLPLGAMPATEYDQAVLPMRSGDRVALYTDGVTESFSGTGLEFGVDGLKEALGTEIRQPLSILKQTALTKLRGHVGERGYEDDVTLLLIEVL